MSQSAWTWRRIIGLLWPLLDPLTIEETRQHDELLEADKKTIERLAFDSDDVAVIEEARRMADAESERRRGADQKAATYLAVVAALVPLVLTVATAIWDKKAGNAPTWLNMLLLGIAVAYVSAAGAWAFQVLKVGGVRSISVADFDAAARAGAPAVELARRTIRRTRLDYDAVNAKVSRIKMTHVFLLRAFLTFSALLLANIGHYFFDSVDPWLVSADRALAAEREVDRLERRLAVEPATKVFAALCRRREPGATLDWTPIGERMEAPAPALTRILRLGAGEQVRFRYLGADCGERRLGELQLWETATRATDGSIFAEQPQTAIADPFGDLRVTRFWPPTTGPIPEQLPESLLRQRGVLSVEGRPSAYIVARFGPGALGLPPDR